MSISIIGLTACARPPYYPRTKYGTIEEFVIQPPKINSIKTTDKNVLKKGSKVAVFSFKSPSETQAGSLISDMFSSLLQKKSYRVVERDNIDRILREQNIIEGEKTNLSDLEVANRLGKLIAADYMIFGAVTLYSSEPQRVYLPIGINKDDRDSYEKRYSKYRDQKVNDWRIWMSREDKIDELRAKERVLSIPELEEELQKSSKITTRVIASVGITAKIVDVKKGEIIWLGQAETTDFTTVGATQRILDTFYESMQ